MSGKRRRAVESVSFEAWLSALPGATGEKSYIRVTSSLLRSEKYQSLTFSARFVFQCMALESGGHVEFVFPEATASKHYGISPATLRNAVRELIANNIISYASEKRERGKPVPYRFNHLAWRTDEKTNANQPTAPRPPP